MDLCKYVNTAQEYQLAKASGTKSFLIGVRCDAEGSRQRKEIVKKKIGKFLGI